MKNMFEKNFQNEKKKKKIKILNLSLKINLNKTDQFFNSASKKKYSKNIKLNDFFHTFSD